MKDVEDQEGDRVSSVAAAADALPQQGEVRPPVGPKGYKLAVERHRPVERRGDSV
ncbi:MAG TPA: hypothetical protein VHR88_05225 [Solirubrobacteraceae bacterium]|nr:hypothetical protein [Solirubrobacteraceae bacterium]